ncbi:HEPN domain-containing protein [Sedimentibacter hydroxybenzoicus DSM 7310]|uniref:HEPN domain-containing protein n=1 Tax=Sedimentibacter hydroxybenzoicus DSM 7310 TaxID=1123245 RepID=A0A974GV43_SEDHY|nr:HEPN domain-containing protein [Sedimentibacter hydroxybenzoicus]NYB72982.1 HEPN domain-containing protein [Sedimentibacter hydroxybenzoicus DSM 7310]
MIQNDYYHIAMNDFEYLNAVKDLPYYNQHCIACQQIGEKLLKHIITLSYIEDDKDKILKSHSLRTIYRAIHRYIPDFILPEEELANLTDYYFDAKYPGSDFFTANAEDFNKCYASLLKIIEQVNKVIQ